MVEYLFKCSNYRIGICQQHSKQIIILNSISVLHTIAIGQRRWNHWTATKIKLILIIVTCLFKKDGEKSSITHLCNVFESSQTAFRMLILLMVALCERARAFASLCTLFLRFYYPFFESCIYSCSYLCEPNWIEKERKKEITNKLIETHICDMVYVVFAFF